MNKKNNSDGRKSEILNLFDSAPARQVQGSFISLTGNEIQGDMVINYSIGDSSLYVDLLNQLIEVERTLRMA